LQDASFVQPERRVDALGAQGRLPVASVVAEHQDAALVGVPVRQDSFDPGDVLDHVVAADVVGGLVRQVEQFPAYAGVQAC